MYNASVVLNNCHGYRCCFVYRNEAKNANGTSITINILFINIQNII